MNSSFSPDCINFLYKIKSSYPQFIFREGKKFAFHPPKTVVIGPQEPFWELLLLHEVSHAILGHKAFKTDVERLKMESEAWNQAEKLTKTLNIPFNTDFAESQLDSYRNWLHQKSLCKTCGLTRFETPDGKYHCPRCDS